MPGFYIQALIEELDAYMGLIVETILLLGGAGAKLSDKQIEYSDLLKFDSFDEARDHLIEREVDRVLRTGVAGQVEWLNTAGFKIPLDHSIVLKTIELGERRNCIVHASGIVNRHYLQNCKTRGVSTGNLKDGDSLKPDKEYLGSAFETILVFGCMIFTAAWIKFCKSMDKDWDRLLEELNDIIYNLMTDGEWNTAKSLLRFTLNDTKLQPSDMYRRMLKINLALCVKETGGKDEALAILSSEDWRGTDHGFQAAVCAVRNETDDALNFLRTGFAAKQIDKQGLIEWPVFNRIRPLKKFKKLYGELLGEEEAERVLAEPVERKLVGPGMEKIMADFVGRLSRIQADGDAAQADEASGKTAKPDNGDATNIAKTTKQRQSKSLSSKRQATSPG